MLLIRYRLSCSFERYCWEDAPHHATELRCRFLSMDKYSSVEEGEEEEEEEGLHFRGTCSLAL